MHSFAVVAIFVASAASLTHAITIPTVPIGDPGNSPDPLTGNRYGSVAYTYNIGMYEITASQYAVFLNAVAGTDTNNLYNIRQARTDVGSGIIQSGSSGSFTYSVDPAFAQRPVTHVSFWDATRFANWMHNGQPTGAQDSSTTEDGAYTLTPSGITANTVARNAGWQWAVTSEDEWYKAAYYKGGGTDSGFWLYPTGRNTIPGNDLSDVSGNNCNYRTTSSPFPIESPYYTTTVGEFQSSASAYGTFDQGGNVYEWNEAVPVGSTRGLRGGSFGNNELNLRASTRFSALAESEDNNRGFRLTHVPAPSALALVGTIALASARHRRRM